MSKFAVKVRLDTLEPSFSTPNNSNNQDIVCNASVSLSLDFFADGKFISSLRKSIGEVRQFVKEVASSPQFPADAKIPESLLDTNLNSTVTGQEVETFFDVLLKIEKEDFWRLECNSKFLQYVEPDRVSNMTELRFHVLNDQLLALQSTVQRWEEQIKSTEEKIVSLKEWVKSNPLKVAAAQQVESAPETARFSDTTDDATSRAEDSIENDVFKYRRPELPHQISTLSNASIQEETTSVDNVSDDRTVSSQPINYKNLQQHPAEHDPELQCSTFLPPSLVRLILENTTFEVAIGEILEFLSQSHEQSHQQLVNYLLQQLQPYLPNKIYDIGMHSIDYSLVDDEIKLLVLEDRISAEPLEKVAFQAFRSIATTTTVSKRQKENSVIDTRANESNGEYTVAFNHLQQKARQLTATVNQLPLMVQFQSTAEVALLLFFDEVNQLIGKDNLFQKSVHLIRAWWIYESILYVGATIKHYLPNNAFMIMIVAVFNKYHHLVNTPFQALCVFLHEYSCYLPTTHAITVEGFVDVKQTISPDEAVPVPLSEIADGFGTSCGSSNVRTLLLIDDQVIAKYQGMCGIQHQHVELLDITNGVYIANPLDGSNMVVDKLTANQVIRLTKALQNGANNLAVFIRQLQDKTVSNASQLIKNYFPNIISAISNTGNPSSTNLSTSKAFDIRGVPATVNKSREEIRKVLVECIHYEQLITRGSIHLDALRCLLRSILRDFPNQGLQLSDILAEMMHRVSSEAREQLIQLSSDILISLVQVVRDEVEAQDTFDGDENIVVLEDHDVDPVIMLRARPRPSASFGQQHPHDSMPMHMGASSFMDPMAGRGDRHSHGGFSPNDGMGKNSPHQMHHKHMKAQHMYQNSNHNNHHYGHHGQNGRVSHHGNHGNYGRGGGGQHYPQHGGHYSQPHGGSHHSPYHNQAQQHGPRNQYNSPPQGHGGHYNNHRNSAYGGDGVKMMPNSFPQHHGTMGNADFMSGHQSSHFPSSANYTRNKVSPSTATSSLTGSFRSHNNHSNNHQMNSFGGQDMLSGLGGLGNSDGFGLSSQRGGGFAGGLRGANPHSMVFGADSHPSSQHAFSSSILPPSNPLGFPSSESSLSSSSLNSSFSSNLDARRQDMWFEGF